MYLSINSRHFVFLYCSSINSCLCYLAFLQKGSKTLWKEGTFFLLRSRSMPFAKGERCSFLCTKEKSQKKCATLQVDRLRQSTVPQGLICSRTYGAFRGTAPVPESKGLGIFGSRADFANLIGALVRDGSASRKPPRIAPQGRECEMVCGE